MSKTKLVLALTMMFVMVLSSFALIAHSATVTVDTSTQSMTVKGVLNSDYYSLYPYNNNSIDIGFSKYGELINATGSVAVGLQYPGYGVVGTYNQSKGTSRDPFANELIPDKNVWVNGWLLNITYRNPIVAKNVSYRNVWAEALFADGSAYGGDWKVTAHPATGLGGRQTNAVAVTDPLQVLENDPRSFVAVSTTHISDTANGVTWPLIDVFITINFNKDTKEIMLYKDLKTTIENKHMIGQMDIQFGDRGEWDLGPPTGQYKTQSYSEYFQEPMDTSYGSQWHLADALMKEMVDTFPTTMTATRITVIAGQPQWYGYKLSCPTMENPFVNGSESVFLDGIYQVQPAYQIVIYEDSWYVAFPTNPYTSHDYISVNYKNYIYDTFTFGKASGNGIPQAYNLAQVISERNGVSQSDHSKKPGAYVGFAAYWPLLSAYTPDGWYLRQYSLINTTQSLAAVEPDVPFLVGQWDTMLPGEGGQFRGVEVIGITDRHDATNPDMNAPFNNNPNNPGVGVIDREVLYQLAQVFTPWDLVQAVEKQTSRWVQFYYITADDVALASAHGYYSFFLVRPDGSWNQPILYAPIWDQYNSQSERVLWGGQLKNPIRYPNGTQDYELLVDPSTGYGVIWIPAASLPAAGTRIEVLYSTGNTAYSTGFTISDSETFGVMKGSSMRLTGASEFSLYPNATWTDAIGVTHTVTTGDFSGTFMPLLSTPKMNLTWTYSEGSLEWQVAPFTVYKEDSTTMNVGDDNFALVNATAYNVTGYAQSKYPMLIQLNDLSLLWNIMGPGGLDVHFAGWDFDVNYAFTVQYVVHLFPNGTINPLYGEHYVVTGTLQYAPEDGRLFTDTIPGRYEWGIVGRDAQSVDSAGLSMVSAAYKDKFVEYALAGADKWNTNYKLQMPSVMSNMTGTYKDSLGRAALKDDYCTTYAISSSNIIYEGGYYANLLAYYANDFTEGYYNSTLNVIVPLSCWGKLNPLHNYNATATIGYGVITTYLDLNGTAIIGIWGLDGRDTYQTSKWFMMDGIFELQNCTLFKGTTAMVVKINYAIHNPTILNGGITVVEVLGTVSEHNTITEIRPPDWYTPPSTWVPIVKGGIHDP